MTELPERADEDVWIVVRACGEHDLLFGNPHTYLGRMAAWCPHRRESFAVSKSEILDMSRAAAAWVAGFLAGSEPDSPLNEDGWEVDDDDPRFAAWRESTTTYLRTGTWPTAGEAAVGAGAADDASRYVRFRSPDHGGAGLVVVRRWEAERVALFVAEDSSRQGPVRAGALLEPEVARAVLGALAAFVPEP